MTVTDIDILKTAIDWAKAEMFSAMFFTIFGLLFLIASVGFWHFGKTAMAKAYVIPSAFLPEATGPGSFQAARWRSYRPA